MDYSSISLSSESFSAHFLKCQALALCLLFSESWDSGPTTIILPQGRYRAVLTLIPTTSIPCIQTVFKSLFFPAISSLQTPSSNSSCRHPAEIGIHLLAAGCCGVRSGCAFFCLSPSPIHQPMERHPEHILMMPSLCLRLHGGTCSLPDPSGLPVLFEPLYSCPRHAGQTQRRSS